MRLKLLIAALSIASFGANAEINNKLCSIDFAKVSDIGFFANNNVSIDNKAEGAFTVTANGERSMIYVYAEEGITSQRFIHGRDFVWVVDGHEMHNLGEHVEFGEIGGTDTREFHVYPKVIPDFLHSGEFDASLDLRVECRAILR